MNTVGYFEIQVENPQNAIEFYSQVFGWNFVKDNNMPIDYWRIENAGIYGGLLKRPTKTPSSGYGTNAFVCSIQVSSFDTLRTEILKNGGAIALEKFAVPGKCWQGYFLDAEGNTFGLFQVDENAK